MIQLRNGRVTLALHTLQAAEGLPLLLLHPLGGSAQDFARATPAWPGPIHALDFSGHGHSGRTYGGGYYAELWAADADAALARLGEAVLLGKGLGAYVALLLAGARRDHVRCAVLLTGEGLEAGGPAPDLDAPPRMPDLPTSPRAQALQPTPSTDPNALAGQPWLLRPPDYAARLAQAAQRLIMVEDEQPKPPWWLAVREAPNAIARTDAEDALRAAIRSAQPTSPAPSR